jgi:hypothetical protein
MTDKFERRTIAGKIGTRPRESVANAMAHARSDNSSPWLKRDI